MNEYYVGMEAVRPNNRSYTIGYRVKAEDWNGAAKAGIEAAKEAGYIEESIFVQTIKRK